MKSGCALYQDTNCRADKTPSKETSPGILSFRSDSHPYARTIILYSDCNSCNDTSRPIVTLPLNSSVLRVCTCLPVFTFLFVDDEEVLVVAVAVADVGA